MYKCPHCGKQGISKLRKMFLGPTVPAICKVCGKKVGVPYTALLTVLPFIVCVFAAYAVEDIAIKAALWITGFIAMTVTQMVYVPLEKR